MLLHHAFILFQGSWSVNGQISSQKPSLTIVHMGESFSSGAGARDPEGNAKWIGPSSCYRSPYGWGQRFADSMNDTYLVNYTNIDCVGSKLSYIKNANQRRHDRIPAQN